MKKYDKINSLKKLKKQKSKYEKYLFIINKKLLLKKESMLIMKKAINYIKNFFEISLYNLNQIIT